jgi:hypothetical protein
MLRHVDFVQKSSEKAEYQLVPSDDAEHAERDNTALFHQIPVEVLALIASRLSKRDLAAFSLVNKKNHYVYKNYFAYTQQFSQFKIEHLAHIASFLPQEDIIPFFLTNRNTLHAFEDFKGNTKHGRLRVHMPSHQESEHQGSPAETSFRDVNHVLMTQYFLRINMNELEANKDAIVAADESRTAIAFGTCCLLGLVVGISAHLGGAVLCDQVILPKFCEFWNPAYNQGCPNMWHGQICNDIPPIFPQTDCCNLWLYRGCNILFCYIPAPLFCSLPTGYAVCNSPAYKCCCNLDREKKPCLPCLNVPTYDSQHDSIQNKIESLNSAKKINFKDIIDMNTQLRERKIGGITYSMFNQPPAVKMEDAPHHDEQSHASPTPARIRME